MPVRVVERAGHLAGDLHRGRDRKLLLPRQPVPQRLPFHERHDVVGRPADLTAVDQAEDVGMLQRRDRLDLAQEPLGADDGGQLGPENLDRDLAVVLQVLGQIDRGHAALAELALDAVAAAEGGGERVRHDDASGVGFWDWSHCNVLRRRAEGEGGDSRMSP